MTLTELVRLLGFFGRYPHCKFANSYRTKELIRSWLSTKELILSWLLWMTIRIKSESSPRWAVIGWCSPKASGKSEGGQDHHVREVNQEWGHPQSSSWGIAAQPEDVLASRACWSVSSHPRNHGCLLVINWFWIGGRFLLAAATPPLCLPPSAPPASGKSMFMSNPCDPSKKKNLPQGAARTNGQHIQGSQGDQEDKPGMPALSFHHKKTLFANDSFDHLNFTALAGSSSFPATIWAEQTSYKNHLCPCRTQRYSQWLVKRGADLS